MCNIHICYTYVYVYVINIKKLVEISCNIISYDSVILLKIGVFSSIPLLEREVWAKQFINNIARLYKYLPSALFYYWTTVCICIAEARRWRSRVRSYQDWSVKNRSPFSAATMHRTTLLSVPGNPFISIFNCRYAVCSVT